MAKSGPQSAIGRTEFKKLSGGFAEGVLYVSDLGTPAEDHTGAATTMQLTLVSLLLLIQCQCRLIGGFRLLSASFSSRSVGQDTAVPSWGTFLQTATTLRRRTRRAHEREHVTMMTSFREGMVRGVGGEEATSPATPDADARAKVKCPVLICPAQLSVPGDYRKTVAEFEER